MYRCQQCGTVVGPSIPAHRLVVESRTRHYPARERVNFVSRPRENPRERWTNDPGGVGVETVRELLVCAECAGEA